MATCVARLLDAGGRLLDERQARCAAGSVAWRDETLLLGGQPVHLWATRLGRQGASPRAFLAALVPRLQRAGLNAIEAHGWVPDPPLVEAAEELGLALIVLPRCPAGVSRSLGQRLRTDPRGEKLSAPLARSVALLEQSPVVVLWERETYWLPLPGVTRPVASAGAPDVGALGHSGGHHWTPDLPVSNNWGTLRVSSAAANGLPMKRMPASSTPWWTIHYKYPHFAGRVLTRGDLVPSYSDLGQPLRDALQLCEDRAMHYLFEGVPYCIVPEYLAGSADAIGGLYDSTFYSMNRVTLEGGKDPSEYVQRNQAGLYPAPCATCELRGVCSGVRPEYLVLFGEGELAPLHGIWPPGC